MKKGLRKSVWESLSKFESFCDKEDFIEATEWNNLEGIDIVIFNKGSERHVSLSYGEIEAIQYLATSLKVENFENGNPNTQK